MKNFFIALALFGLAGSFQNPANADAQFCTDSTLDVFRKMKSYFGWIEERCEGDRQRQCISVLISDQSQYARTLEVFSEKLEIGGCEVRLRYWNPGWESGVTIHN